jgi:hypothetical protein
VLLVHDAFADGSMWAGVITELQAAGIGVIAVASPLRSLTSDAAYLASAAAEIDGPILLAGHGYGGAVITAAGSAAGNVAGLVYVAAFALDKGESALDITSRFPGSQLIPALRPAAFAGADGDPALELYIDREAYPRVFAADLPYRPAAATAAAQRPITAAAFEEKSPEAGWKTAPSWYIVATADQVITPEGQQFMARRAGAHSIEIDASHAIALTQPAAVAGHIAAAASSASRRRHDRPARPRGSAALPHPRVRRNSTVHREPTATTTVTVKRGRAARTPPTPPAGTSRGHAPAIDGGWRKVAGTALTFVQRCTQPARSPNNERHGP